MPVPPPPRGTRRLWPLVAAFSVLVVVAIGITAVVTAAIMKSSTTAAPPPAAPAQPAAPQYSAAEQASAKQNVCQAFEAGERGSTGAVVTNGDLNIPTVLRMVNAHAAVQSALSPAVPTDVAAAARTYLTSNLDVTTAALANKPVDQLNGLTATNNNAIDALAEACGLPH